MRLKDVIEKIRNSKEKYTFRVSTMTLVDGSVLVKNKQVGCIFMVKDRPSGCNWLSASNYPLPVIFYSPTISNTNQRILSRYLYAIPIPHVHIVDINNGGEKDKHLDNMKAILKYGRMKKKTFDERIYLVERITFGLNIRKLLYLYRTMFSIDNTVGNILPSQSTANAIHQTLSDMQKRLENINMARETVRNVMKEKYDIRG